MLNKKINNAIQAIKRGKQDPDTLEYLTRLKVQVADSIEQENYSVNAKLYELLGNLEHSLYRYNELIRAGLSDLASQEGKYFTKLSQSADNALMLKAGISNTTYIWHTEPGACEECQALDEYKFVTFDDIPARPHPNCKCKIEQLTDAHNEQCDCYKMIEQMEKLIGQGESLSVEIQSNIDRIQDVTLNYSNTRSDYVQSLINDLVALEQPYNTLMQTVGIFLTNFTEMKDAATKNADKYFHAKANCEAAQRGLLGEIIAEALSNFREFIDSFRNIKEKHLSIEASLKDIEEDQDANREGRNLGHRHPLIDAYDLLKHRIPKGFPERYKKK